MKKPRQAAWFRVGFAALIPIAALVLYGVNNDPEVDNTPWPEISGIGFLVGLGLLGLAIYRAK